MVKAIFFDLWNTILYCPTKDRVGKMIGKLGLEGKVGYNGFIDDMEATVFIDSGYAHERLFRRLCEKNGVECGDDAVKEAEAIWESRLQDAAYFPEAEAALSDLRGDYKLGLISNTDASGAEYVKAKGVDRMFDTAIMSCYAGKAKPDPAIYKAAAETLGLDVKDCVMVGDNPKMDVEGAVAAGLGGVLIDRSGGKKAAKYPVINNLTQLRKVIR
jgi:HAD superfamily hydrolase (TIGR01549 family)